MRILKFNETSALISFVESCKTFKQALQIQAQITVNGFHKQIFPVSRLISFFALFGSEDALTHSQTLLSQIDRPNLFIWNTVMRGYSRSDDSRRAISVYKSMLHRAEESPNNFTFPFLINSCTKLSTLYLGLQVHAQVVRFGFELDVFVGNALMHFYSVFKCSDDAQKVFDGMLVRDLVSYNTMINGYALLQQPGIALEIFREMLDSNIKPDTYTVVALSSTCLLLNDSKLGRQVHAFVYRNRFSVDSNLLLKTVIIDMYAKCGSMHMAERVFSSMENVKSAAAWSSMVSGYARLGKTEVARHMFDQMENRDVICSTAMISCYSQAGQYSEALEIFVEIEGLGIIPDDVCVVAALSACSGLGALNFGEKIHRKYIENELLRCNIILSTALIDMYAKCGKIVNAIEIFRRIPESLRTVYLFNSMISGLAKHGLGKDAIDIFREMETAGLSPDSVSFVAVLCACSHSGLAEEGNKLFKLMLDVYGIRPQMEHYSCLVDLLGRDGCVNEAYDVIRSMPYEANSVIWRALLGACRMHRNSEIGNIAAKQLINLEPEHGARYVLLSNLLADKKQWEEAGRVRKVMEQRGIQKPVAWSCIEWEGTLHRFLASDRAHLQCEKIKAKLDDMVTQMKSAGYVPDTGQVVFDLEEEEKETVVSYHSEKLALAYGLINCRRRATIRIIKNLRICGDCHSAFKLLSGIYERDILVRDAIRFHHFKNGSCSCRDFW